MDTVLYLFLPDGSFEISFGIALVQHREQGLREYAE